MAANIERQDLSIWQLGGYREPDRALELMPCSRSSGAPQLLTGASYHSTQRKVTPSPRTHRSSMPPRIGLAFWGARRLADSPCWPLGGRLPTVPPSPASRRPTPSHL